MTELPTQEIDFQTRKNNSHKEIIESFFKESSDLGASCDTKFCAIPNLTDTTTTVDHTRPQMYLKVAKCSINPNSIVK